MKSNDINDIVEGRSAADPTPVAKNLGRIYVLGLLALILIVSALFLWRRANVATTNASGTDSSNINAVQPRS